VGLSESPRAAFKITLGSSKITLPAHKSGPKKYHFIPNALVAAEGATLGTEPPRG
jgi:hypothetical protein